MTSKVAIIDYGMGNLFSVKRSMQHVGANVAVLDNPSELENFKYAILPGVGAFSDGMRQLLERGWVDPIIEFSKRNYLLGVCLGMQLLAEKGYEPEKINGLGLIPGEVVKLQQSKGQKLPHVGWNQIKKLKEDSILLGVPDEEDFYFAHSYHFVLNNSIYALASTDYGQEFFSIVKKGRTYGFQCHPEKSGNMGLKVLVNFLKQK